MWVLMFDKEFSQRSFANRAEIPHGSGTTLSFNDLTVQ